MTKDKKRKADVRAVQQATGWRYTQVAREWAQTTGGVGRTFLLKELLTECATLPPAAVTWTYDEVLAPAVFESRLLGAVVPYGTVLELAGALAQQGTNAQLLLESLDPLETSVVVYGERRFSLVLSQDLVFELCRKPGCVYQLVSPIIAWCRDHLADCGTDALAAIASEWGHARSEELAGSDLARLGGSREADLLVKAAVARGAFEIVSTSLLHACFEDLEVLDDPLYDEVRAVDMRHAIERERIRLQRVAQAESRRLRQSAVSCAACGTVLMPHGDLRLPPQYCSKDCVPAPRASSGAAAPKSPWDALA
ncbi:hypothetical protein ACFV3F_04705 [Streptomyces sp. NPDC059717]|uniref:hypothetical protein n=1 Tax=Streptomyces sp. NPDC059717 TaxID=3346922 RepID=UPI003698778F